MPFPPKQEFEILEVDSAFPVSQIKIGLATRTATEIQSSSISRYKFPPNSQFLRNLTTPQCHTACRPRALQEIDAALRTASGFGDTGDPT